MCFFADLCFFVPLFLFRSFCSAIFVLLFLFCWGLFALKPHLPYYLIDHFCSTDLLHLHLPIFVLLFLFRYFCSTGAFFCSAIFVPLTFLHLHLPIFVPLFLFCYFCSAGPFFVLLFLFHYFCSTIFVLLGPFFVPLFLFRWGLFLFCYFCFADLFALALTNFCSAIFVPLFLFSWGLFAFKLKPIFVPLFLFCWGLFALKPHLPHYLIDNFCSADSAHQFLFR